MKLARKSTPEAAVAKANCFKHFLQYQIETNDEICFVKP